MLVSVGHTALEELFYPGRDRIRVKGGSGFRCAAAAAAELRPYRRHGAGVGLVTRIGDDFPLSDIQRLGIDTAGVKQVPGLTTRITNNFVLPDSDSGRTVVVKDNVSADMSPEDIPDKYLQQASAILFSTTEPAFQRACMDFVESRCEQLRIEVPPLLVDSLEQYIRLFPDDLERVLESSQALFANLDEYELITDWDAMWELLETQRVFVKTGPKGAMHICLPEGKMPRVKTPEPPGAPIININGTGDVLAGATAAVLYELGRPVREALIRGVDAGYQAAQGRGPLMTLN